MARQRLGSHSAMQRGGSAREGIKSQPSYPDWHQSTMQELLLKHVGMSRSLYSDIGPKGPCMS